MSNQKESAWSGSEAPSDLTSPTKGLVHRRIQKFTVPSINKHCPSHEQTQSQQRQGLQSARPSSPVPSHMSMKSSASLQQPVNFKGEDDGDTHERDQGPKKAGSSSSVPSCLSIRSEGSLQHPVNFGQDESQTEERWDSLEQTLPQNIHTGVNIMSTIFQELELKVIEFMKDELKAFRRLLSHGCLESPWNEEEEEEGKLQNIREGALKITVHILRDMSQEGLAQQLEKYSSIQQCKQQLKFGLSKKFQKVFEGIPKQGKSTSLEKIYTELRMIEGESAEVNCEHEVRQIEMISKRPETGQDTSIKCHDIFRSLPLREQPIRNVLTKGVAGIGKTVSVQKFTLDWAKERANQDIDFLFPLPFRELNLYKDERYSLMDIIHHFFPETKKVTFSNQSRDQLAFVLDGLDENRLPLDFQHGKSIYDPAEPAPLDVIVTNLIKGNLLPSAHLWITSRPAAANQIPAQYIDRVTEVQGFNDAQKDEYLRKQIPDEELADSIITHLKSSRSLYIMCHIPVFCWMAATILEFVMTQTESTAIPKSLTEMYAHFLIIQIKYRSQKYQGHTDSTLWNLNTILSLGKLALHQLEKGNVIFYEKDLKDCGIDCTVASLYSGVCTQIFKEVGLYKGKVFCFVHLSIQEFLAALYATLQRSLTVGHTADECQSSQLSSLLTATPDQLYKAAVDLALKNENGHLDLFLRFLLGLSLESNQTLLQDLFLQTKNISLNTEETVRYIKDNIREVSNPERCINLLHCLNELNDQTLVEEVRDYLTKRDKTMQDLSLSQLSAVAFVLLMSEQDLKEFNLEDYGDSTSPARSDAGLLRMLPVVKVTKTVKLMGCNLTEKSCEALSSVLTSNSSSLTEMDISGNNVGDNGVRLLSVGLESPNCKLKKLALVKCNLTEKSCGLISSVVSSSASSLTQLHLSGNNVGDSGLELLSTGLKHPNCKLETLDLMGCSVTERCCGVLASVLSSKSSRLTQLVLSVNMLGDSGVELLSTGLKHPHCGLRELDLRKSKITELSCGLLSTVLSSRSSSLTKLVLSENSLGDSGIRLLSTGLEHPNCRVAELELRECNLREMSGGTLSSVLSSKCSILTQLDLSGNHIGDSGVELLSTGLKHQNCKLKKLDLRGCKVTEKSCGAFAAALSSNSSSLTQLVLSQNNLGDSGVSLLCTGLEHANCKLEKLELYRCKFTVQSCGPLSSVLHSTTSCLSQLDVSVNNLGDTGVELLTNGLKHPNCRLEKLE